MMTALLGGQICFHFSPSPSLSKPYLEVFCLCVNACVFQRSPCLLWINIMHIDQHNLISSALQCVLCFANLSCAKQMSHRSLKLLTT